MKTVLYSKYIYLLAFAFTTVVEAKMDLFSLLDRLNTDNSQETLAEIESTSQKVPGLKYRLFEYLEERDPTTLGSEFAAQRIFAILREESKKEWIVYFFEHFSNVSPKLKPLFEEKLIDELRSIVFKKYIKPEQYREELAAWNQLRLPQSVAVAKMILSQIRSEKGIAEAARLFCSIGTFSTIEDIYHFMRDPIGNNAISEEWMAFSSRKIHPLFKEAALELIQGHLEKTEGTANRAMVTFLLFGSHKRKDLLQEWFDKNQISSSLENGLLYFNEDLSIRVFDSKLSRESRAFRQQLAQDKVVQYSLARRFLDSCAKLLTNE